MPALFFGWVRGYGYADGEGRRGVGGVGWVEKTCAGMWAVGQSGGGGEEAEEVRSMARAGEDKPRSGAKKKRGLVKQRDGPGSGDGSSWLVTYGLTMDLVACQHRVFRSADA